MINVGYQGETGAYSEGAIYKYLGKEINAISYKNFEDVFESILRRNIKYMLLTTYQHLRLSIVISKKM